MSSTPYFSVQAPIECLGDSPSDMGAQGIKADVIAESTSAAGVTIDGVRLKDNDIRTDEALLHASHVYVATSSDEVFFVAPRACRVKIIRGRPYVAGTDGGTVTAAIRKVPSGTAIASGTLLHTGTMNLKGTVDTNQTLTLSSTPADLELAAGDALAIDFTGVLTSARGVITVGLAPR